MTTWAGSVSRQIRWGTSRKRKYFVTECPTFALYRTGWLRRTPCLSEEQAMVHWRCHVVRIRRLRYSRPRRNLRSHGYVRGLDSHDVKCAYLRKMLAWLGGKLCRYEGKSARSSAGQGDADRSIHREVSVRLLTRFRQHFWILILFAEDIYCCHALIRFQVMILTFSETYS